MSARVELFRSKHEDALSSDYLLDMRSEIESTELGCW
ncbi:hypothetical protein M2302_002910 [Micromonospora sp. A200]|nr:hypothetical protein [Micromonospora sp. A200]